MHSKKNTNIYQLAREIQEQSQQAEIEAKKIANAYRYVEQLRVAKPSTNMNQDIGIKSKGQSSYANKVKQTLKELNANKAKQMELMKNVQTEKINPQSQKILPEESKLKRAAAMKILNLVEKKQQKAIKQKFQMLKQINKEINRKESDFIRKWKMNRIFNAWRDEIILIKIEKDKMAKQNQKLQKHANDMAVQFRKFTLIKKCFREWDHQIKKERKRKIYQLQIRKVELEQKIKQKPISDREPTNQNSQLQGKLRGFLDGLKDKIQNKDRLKTIKEKTEESQFRIRQQQQPSRGETSHNISSVNHQESIQESQESNRLESMSNRALINQETRREPYDEKKPLNSQELQKKRKQLEDKYKNRKENLEKLKKAKDDKKKEEERQRLQLEREIELEQKKIKQEQYRLFLKNKQQQQEWEKKEKVLTKKAEDFNQIRLLKYYGWNNIVKLKEIKAKNCNQMKRIFLKIQMRVNFQKFIQEISQITNQKMSSAYAKMNLIYQRKLFKKCLLSFRSEYLEQKHLKEELTIRHQVNTLKVSLLQYRFASNNGRRLSLIQQFRIFNGRDLATKRLKHSETSIQCQKGSKVSNSIKALRKDKKIQNNIRKKQRLRSKECFNRANKQTMLSFCEIFSAVIDLQILSNIICDQIKQIQIGLKVNIKNAELRPPKILNQQTDRQFYLRRGLMIPSKIKNEILSKAQQAASQVRALKSFQPLLVRGEVKYDKIDSKFLKEAEKINSRQLRALIKTDGERPEAFRKGSITYKSYPLEFKKNLIETIREQFNKGKQSLSKIIRAYSQEYRIHPKNISRWYQTKELKKKEGGRRALYPQMELRLANFIINNPKMKRKHILRQARQIMEDLSIPGWQNFNFSKGWYQRFRQRLAKRKILQPIKKEQDDTGPNKVKKQEEDSDSIKMQNMSMQSESQFMDYEEGDEDENIDSNEVKIEEICESQSHSSPVEVKKENQFRMRLRSRQRDDQIFESSKSRIQPSIEGKETLSSKNKTKY